MTYPIPNKLSLPIEPYKLSDEGRVFGERMRRWVFFWTTHLGDDIVVSPGTTAKAVGEGSVVWAEMRLGSEDKKNWGGIVVVAHGADKTAGNRKLIIDNDQYAFYSVYGHLKDLTVKVGDEVVGNQKLGEVAAGLTAENGWWMTPHLHFGIYVGPWKNQILPGWWRVEEWRTRVAWWKNPMEFIEAYNR